MNEQLHKASPEPVNKPPHPCCGEFALVTGCNEIVDQMYCPVCQSEWTQPCSAVL